MPPSLSYPSALDHHGSLSRMSLLPHAPKIPSCRTEATPETRCFPLRSCSRVAIVHHPVSMHVGDSVVFTKDVPAPPTNQPRLLSAEIRHPCTDNAPDDLRMLMILDLPRTSRPTIPDVDSHQDTSPLSKDHCRHEVSFHAPQGIARHSPRFRRFQTQHRKPSLFQLLCHDDDDNQGPCGDSDDGIDAAGL